MDINFKYQYTYFIHPYIIKQEEYQKYISKLLKNKDISLKTHEKERDLNLYTYFSSSIKNSVFPTFELSKEEKRKIEENKATIEDLMKLPSLLFEINLKQNLQGKTGEEEGVFFEIGKIELICFKTGICFLILKTNIENTTKFYDLLNFNYKFNSINSDFSDLKEFENIKIQTDKFSNMKELSEYIKELTFVSENIELIENEENKALQRFFTFSYVCIEQEYWNEQTNFKTIEHEFLKYINILPSGNDEKLDEKQLEKTDVLDKWKYIKYSVSKFGSMVFCSSNDKFNFTKFPHEYENEYLYMSLIVLYQKIYLTQLNKDFKNNTNIEKIKENFLKFTKQMWFKEITHTDTGTNIYEEWNKTFQLNGLYKEVEGKYNIVYEQEKNKKNNMLNRILLIVLGISLTLNIINLVLLLLIK